MKEFPGKAVLSMVAQGGLLHASLSCSADTQKEIDEKVVELVKREHEKAKKILTDNRKKLDELAMFLYEKETITGEEFMKILNNKEESEEK